MRGGRVILRGIVQGVGFRPFIYAKAEKFGIRGSVINHGSEVEITAFGNQFEEFCSAVSKGPKMSVIDSVTIEPLPEGFAVPDKFSILPSADGARTGFIPADIATCESCLADILNPNSRYYGYWGTSCTDCGPRYSIIRAVPYDRERTSMDAFPPCDGCLADYHDPHNRRHHAQTVACSECGPKLLLMTGAGSPVETDDPIGKTAELLDAGCIVAVRGMGGFHICCVEESANRLKELLGRPHQSLAVMMKPESLDNYVVSRSGAEREMLEGPVHPIMILDKRDPAAHLDLSELHNLGVMLPYTGLHHLLFEKLQHPLLVMTSANVPGTPMITETSYITERMGNVAEYILSHDREIVNRCDDSVVRDGYIIRMSRGLAPLRTAMDLGNSQILGVGPELNANATIYKDGFVVTSPHIGNIRNPATVAYLNETIEKLTSLTRARPEIIAHDLHPQFLSTRVAHELAEEYNAVLCPVQHHRAHIASVTTEEVVGIAIDGVGYGDDATIWGGEILTGSPENGYARTGHLEPVLMPGGDLATRFPERMLYGILPDDATLDLLAGRGWDDVALRVLSQQTAKKFNCPVTTSTGRVLDAVAALLGICRERTYDGEPSMMLEAYAARGTAASLPIKIVSGNDGADVLLTSEILKEGRAMLVRGSSVEDAAASIQTALAKGIAEMAVRSVERSGINVAALSGGVAINRSIRETILAFLADANVPCRINPKYPFGDGCISCGQVVTAGVLSKAGKL
ncbi:Carbamoyltransferase HypF [Methanocorpusculaceae archaeon Sp1]|uniref:Carbamoyltransferase n=1 Tax=Methanorbis furvi TaxID=3028299 RepID=A0AAE4MD87_9EURY|nr:Carbamoyltransferase HypF [Methanocorpusculaceae archaeon Sp1]MDV0442134.1 Carbamoyltransferase HypF [Methanocorpusculaceae archaeon Ag1]